MGWFKRSPRSKGYAVLSPVSHGLAALRLDANPEHPRVTGFAFHDGLALAADDLKHMAREAALDGMPLVALLATKDYQTVMVDAPTVPEEEMRGAIRWKVKELINFHVDDAVLDHLPIPAGGGRNAALYVVAAHAQAVRALAKTYQDADLPLEVIDIRETAQHNLARRLAPADYAVAVLHMNGDFGLLTFSFGDALVLSRRIEGRGATAAFLFEKAAMETQRSVDYFERQFSWLPLAKLYLAPMAEAEHLRGKLAEYLPVGVEILDLDRLFDLGGVTRLQDPDSLNTVFHILGAALRPASRTA